MVNILIVDDSRTSRKMLESILTSQDFCVIDQATNGQEAIELYEKHHPDLVTMDITMPVMDGIEALRQIKSKYPSSKVVMVTAAGQKNKIIEALKLGVDDFLTKPYEANEIIETIRKVLNT